MEKFPEHEMPVEGMEVFKAFSKDGSLMMRVFHDDELETHITRVFGGMGTIKVYEISLGEERHSERVALSPEAIFNASPTQDEVAKFMGILRRLAE